MPHVYSLLRASYTCWTQDLSFPPLSTFLALSVQMTTTTMSSWIETQYDPRLNPPYHYQTDHPDGSIREADHTPSMQTVYSATPHHSHNSSRQTYNSGLYGPRPLPAPVDPLHGMSTPAMVHQAMTEQDDADAETMELDPGIDQEPIYDSEYDDGPQPHSTRRFVGGFIKGLRKIPKAMKRGFLPRGAQTPPSFLYQYQPPYHAPYATNHLNVGIREQPVNPPYDAAEEFTEGDLHYSEDTNVPPVHTPPVGPSRSVSHIRAPRTESQPTYQSLTNPSARHHSHHGSLHNAQRTSPPRTVRNPDPATSTEEGSDIRTNANSPRPSHHPAEPEPSPSRTSRISPPLDTTRRPTVTVQSPTGSPVYVEPQLADDYVGMDPTVEPPPELSVPSQFARVGKFFRDLNNLPWVSSNVTVDFNPEDSRHGRQAHTRGTGRSWYTAHLHDLDILGGGAGGSSTRRLTAPSGHSLAQAQGSSATLAPGQGSASSSEGVSTHLPAPHTGIGLGFGPPLSSYPSYPVPQLALPSQPLYFLPATYPAPHPPPPRGPGPNGADHQASPQSSGNSDPGMPRQPYFYVVAMPPAYVGGPVDPSRPMMPYGAPYPPPV